MNIIFIHPFSQMFIGHFNIPHDIWIAMARDDQGLVSVNGLVEQG